MSDTNCVKAAEHVRKAEELLAGEVYAKANVHALLAIFYAILSLDEAVQDVEDEGPQFPEFGGDE